MLLNGGVIHSLIRLFRYLSYREYYLSCDKEKPKVDGTSFARLPLVLKGSCSFFCSQKIVERFERDLSKGADQDIFIRTFEISKKKITLQFHYGPNEVTPTVREYKCPPKPYYNSDVIFDEKGHVIDVVRSPSGKFVLSFVCSFYFVAE